MHAFETAAELVEAIDAAADPENAVLRQRFFKTGPGEYAEGDVFAGVSVPVLRRLARQSRDVPVDEAVELLGSPIHEHRLTALLVLVDRFRVASRARSRDDHLRTRLHSRYLAALTQGQVNNWDLVDSSAETLVGAWLLGPPRQPDALLEVLAASVSLWDRRVAAIATFAFIKAGDPGPALHVAELLIEDHQPLIHKATGWMLREVGKRNSRETLTRFLDTHAAKMPRTMLSYATEQLAPEERECYRGLR